MIGDGATLTFAVEPAGGAHIYANGQEVTGTSARYPIHEPVHLHLETEGTYVLDNWNNGQQFEADWDYAVAGDATITAFLSED